MARPPAELEQQAARYAGLRALAARRLTGVWPRVDWASELAPQAVTVLYRAIVAQFGSTAATLAADDYDDRRGGLGLRRRYRATVAEPVDDEQVRRIVESAFLGTDEPLDVHERRRVRVLTTSELPVQERVPQRLEQSLSRLVMAPARDTVARNAERDPAKPTWLRVPTGETTCAFCIMLASRQLGRNFRGYATRERALFDDNGETFHRGCDCIAVACFPGDDPHVLSPNMRDYFAIYQQSANSAGTRTDFKAVLHEMRKVLKTQDPPPATDPAPNRDAGTDVVDVVDLDAPRRRGDTGDRPTTQTASPPPPPTGPPNPPAAAAADEPEGWSGHVKGYEHPHRTPVWTEAERVARQDALGDAVPPGEQLYQHEIEATERLAAIGETVQWIARGEPDERGRRLPTNDVAWTSKGGVVAEIKSTSTKYRTIRERISTAVVKAAAQGVVKENFIIDIGPRTLKPGLRNSLAQYNIGGAHTRQILALWVLTRGELVPIALE